MTQLDLIKKHVLDNTNDNKQYFFSKTKGNFIIHVSNPYNENVNINDNNKVFYEKLINILFNKKKDGCFNYEHSDYDNIYNLDFNNLVQFFLKNSSYYVIMVDKKLNPLSYLCISDNTIWTVCTNINFRKKGHMTNLFNHILKLMKKNKLKTNVDINNLKIYIKDNNPIKEKLKKYYSSFKFRFYEKMNNYTIMKLHNNEITV